MTVQVGHSRDPSILLHLVLFYIFFVYVISTHLNNSKCNKIPSSELSSV